MKHAYIPRTTTYNLNPGEELNDLRMSDEVRPLYEHVKKFIRETVDPMSVEFMRLGEGKKDRWSFTPDGGYRCALRTLPALPDGGHAVTWATVVPGWSVAATEYSGPYRWGPGGNGKWNHATWG